MEKGVLEGKPMEGQTFNFAFGNQRLPLDPGAVAVDADGTLAGTRQRDFSFRFTYRRIVLSVRFLAGVAPCVEIHGQLGAMPFSAETPGARFALSAILNAANSHLGDGFCVVAGRICLSGTVPLEGAVTAVALVRVLTAFLVPRKPYLELISLYLERPAIEHRAFARR